jgi:phosphoglycerate-specific signal transduction histidine kinase
VTLEAMDVTHDELVMTGVSVQMKLAKDLPLVQGDRVQLLQVINNLIINAIEAMSPHAAGARDLLIRTVKTKSGSVLVAVCDSGPGVDSANLCKIAAVHESLVGRYCCKSLFASLNTKLSDPIGVMTHLRHAAMSAYASHCRHRACERARPVATHGSGYESLI